MLELNETDADKTIELAVGDAIEIRLPENATTGYRWTLKSIDKSICEVATEERHGPDKIVPGAPGTHVWRLKAIQAGDCGIEIAYGRPWRVDAPPARTFKIKLRVRD